jgi:hypothetical protein
MLHPLLSLFLMLLGFLGTFATTALAVAYGSWPIYSIPFIGASIIGWLFMRNRSDEAGLDEKDFTKSSEAFDWLVAKYEEKKEKE